MLKCDYCGLDAELVNGVDIYPHRHDLAHLKFWRCKPCMAYVGCHRPNKKHKNNGTEPLGRLANDELRRWKMRVHSIFDPFWKSGRMDRKQAYELLAEHLGIDVQICHVGMFDVDTCKRAVELIEKWEV